MNNTQSQSNRLLYTGGISSAIAVFLLLVTFPISTQFFEYKITDIKYVLRSMLDKEPGTNPDVVMVNLDDYSKIQSGKALWPYPYYAAVLEKISSGDPTSIGVDIMLTNTIDTSGWGAVLAALEESFLAINPYLVKFGDMQEPIEAAAHREILSELSMDELPQTDLGEIKHVVDIPYKSRDDIMENSLGIGFVTIEPDLDGVLRRLPIVAEINGMLAPHFFLRVLCAHLDYELGNIELESNRKLTLHDFPVEGSKKDIEIPLDGQGNMLINCISYEKVQKLTKSGHFVSLSAWDVINSNTIDLSNKAVIFGDNSAAHRDYSTTPLDPLLPN
ncbi:uncharacterized protein METZ01_LOCUS255943, partial [marine metagenome]